MKYVCFTITMPNVGSWNGKWGGSENLYAKVVKFYKNDKVPECKGYYYNFGDGWGAKVNVREVNSEEAKKIKKASDGFLGYDWMIDSIISNGLINYKEK